MTQNYCALCAARVLEIEYVCDTCWARRRASCLAIRSWIYGISAVDGVLVVPHHARSWWALAVEEVEAGAHGHVVWDILAGKRPLETA